MENEAEKLFRDYKVKEAWPLFLAEAEKGSGRAMYFLSIYYAMDTGVVAPDKNKRLSWLKKGLAAGDPFCGLDLLYPEEVMVRGMKPDAALLSHAKEWEEAVAAMAETDIPAMEVLGLYKIAQFVSTGDEDLLDAGLPFLKQASDEGSWVASLNLGTLFETEGPLEFYSDSDEDALYFGRAIDKGVAEAMTRWGLNLASKTWKKEVHRKGMALIERAARLGHAGANTILGFWLVMTRNKKKQKEGFSYTKFGAERGNPFAMGNLANCYMYGTGTKKDRRLAKEWYIKAADLGMESSAMQLGTIYHEEGDDEKAYALFKKSAEKGFPAAMGWLAACYFNGWGTEENRGLSRMWLEKAAALGDKEAPEALSRYFGVER